jgi:hypothetical protein
MKFVIAEEGSCDYDDESIGDIEFTLRYIHIVQPWVPKELPQLDIDFFINGRMYCIDPSSLHGLGLFSMDAIKVKYGTITKLMEYVEQCYKYNQCLMFF